MQAQNRRLAPSPGAGWSGKSRSSAALGRQFARGARRGIGERLQRLGLDHEALGELLAVVGLYNQMNKLADGYQVEPDVLPVVS